jgi:Ca2+-binding RTX toxin-like protein
MVLTGASGSVAGTNLAATGQPGEPSNAGVSDPIQSAWFVWRAPSTAVWTFDTCGGELDSTIGVYTGRSVSALHVVAQNDDDLTNACALNSRAILDAVSGVRYHISVDGYLDRAAPFALNWSPLACTIIGTSGPDTLAGTAGDDVICGLEGNDQLTGGTGFDTMVGGPGRDRLLGESDDDYAVGGIGADQFDGGTGADNLNAVDRRGGDVVTGESDDLCYGDAADSITGC